MFSPACRSAWLSRLRQRGIGPLWRRVAAAIPDARFEIVRRRTSPQIEQPEASFYIIDGFLGCMSPFDQAVALDVAGRSGSSEEGLERLRQLHDLDEVAAGVVEDGRGDSAHLGGLLGESHAIRSESIELRLNVVDRE